MNYIPQLTKSSCGMACLKMLLAIVHKDEGYLYLNEDENHGQYSYQDLIEVAQHYDVTLHGARIEFKDDLRHFDKFPMILTVTLPNETKHALLVSQRKGKRMKVHDPAKGVYWLKIDRLISIWDGTLLAVNNYIASPYPNPIICSKDKKWSAISTLFQIITAGAIAVATFFIKPETHFVFPIIFVALALISEVLLRFILLKRMQRYDRYIRRFLPYVKRNDYFTFYVRAQEYKKSSLGMSVNLVFSVLIVLLIITISLINSLNYVILILASLIASYLDVFSFDPLKNEIEKEVSNEENELKIAETMNEVEMKVKSMEVKSYRYAYLEFAKKAVVGIVMLLASIALSLAERSFTLTSIIFYMCLSILLYQSLTPLFGYDKRMEANLVNKARINNVVHLDEINSKKS